MDETWSRPWTTVGINDYPTKARLVAEEIASQFDVHRAQMHRQGYRASDGRHTASDGHGGFAILGDRGSGKSTVLHAVCAELDSRAEDLVLPVVYPELFRETDSLLGTFLASLWEFAQDATNKPGTLRSGPESEASFDLLRLILDAANIFAMAQTPLRTLENASLGPEYVDESVAISRSSAKLHRILSEATRAVRECAGGGLLVLPIDDADLSPTGVAGVMRDLRIIGSIPGVTPIACASETDLHSSWMREQFASEAIPSQLRAFRRFMEKLFPYRFRFEIEPLLTSERVNFTPMGTDVCVADLAQRFDDAVQELSLGNSPLRPFRVLTPTHSLVSPLPPNPRALIQVWDSLDAAAKQRSVSALSLGLRRVMQVLGEPIDDATDAAGVPRFARVTHAANAKELRYRVDFDVDAWSLFVSSEAFDTAGVGVPSDATEGSSHARIKLRRLMGVHTSLGRAESEEAARPARSGRLRMPPEVTSAALTIQEFISRANLMDDNGARLLIGHDDYRFLQDVEIAGLETDNLFITLPNLSTYSAVISGAERWNTMVDCVRANAPDIQEVLRLSLLATLAQLRDEDLDLDHSPSYEALFRDLTAEFVAALSVEKNVRKEEQRRLVEWYLQGLPLHWHTALLPVTTIATVVALWTEALSHLQEDSRSSPMDLLKVRLGRILDAAESTKTSEADHVWIAGYFSAVAGIVDPKLYSRLARIYPAWRRRWTIVRTGSASALLSMDADSNDRSITFSPYPTQSGIDLLDSALATLRRLRTAAAQGQIDLAPTS